MDEIEQALAKDTTTPERLVCRVKNSWTEGFEETGRRTIESVLPTFLVQQRWFGGKARLIKATKIVEVVSLEANRENLRLLLINVIYDQGEPETYLLPLAFAYGDRAEQLTADAPMLVLLKVVSESAVANGLIYDASHERDFWMTLQRTISETLRISASCGELAGWHNRNYQRISGASHGTLEPSVLRAEQSNSAAIYGGLFILKLFRKIDQGVNPDLEISRYLTEQLSFAHSPVLAGAIEYHTPDAEPATIAIMHEFHAHSQQAWEFVLNEINQYLERVKSGFPVANLSAELKPETRWIELVNQEPTPLAREAIGSFLQSAELLGRRTAEMHLALGAATDNPSFSAEPFTPSYQQTLSQTLQHHGKQVLQILKKQMPKLPEAAQADAHAIVEMETDILSRFADLAERRITAQRIRCHGDYHLGQVLRFGGDFKLIDFEGEPMRPISERKVKVSPLRDVAGMLRSFHYATNAALMARVSGVGKEPNAASRAAWARFFYVWTSAVFVKAYLAQAGDAAFLPKSHDELHCLLDAYLLEKSLYELDYEMNNRPDWVSIPIRGVLDLMGRRHK